LGRGLCVGRKGFSRGSQKRKRVVLQWTVFFHHEILLWGSLDHADTSTSCSRCRLVYNRQSKRYLSMLWLLYSKKVSVESLAASETIFSSSRNPLCHIYTERNSPSRLGIWPRRLLIDLHRLSQYPPRPHRLRVLRNRTCKVIPRISSATVLVCSPAVRADKS
jgi:hypothetical protein